MRRSQIFLTTLLSLSVIAHGQTPGAPPPAQPDEEQIAGRWNMAEKGLIIELTKTASGRWNGVVIQAASAPEVGKRVFQELTFHPADASFTGKLLKPEDDSTHDVTVTLLPDGSMKAVVKALFFSKTISLVKAK